MELTVIKVIKVTDCNINMRLQGVLKDFRGLPGISGGYMRLKGVTGG